MEDVCKVGDVVPVKLISIDEQGRFKLSRKAALAELGREDPVAKDADARPKEKGHKHSRSRR